MGGRVMNLQVPNLDDRNFDELVSEALTLLPRYAPEWTNHNPSDPGITLIELLAYFTEMLLYQLNRVSRDTKIEFLQLLRGPEVDWRERLDEVPVEDVDEEIRRAVLALREPQRAVTREDFEYLARRATVDDAGGDEGKVARACCVSRRNLARGPEFADGVLPGHVSLVVVPDRHLEPHTLERLLDRVREFLAPRCLLTTQLHVVGPCYVWVSLQLVVRAASGVTDREIVRQAIVSRLEQHFGPYHGCGPASEGWPFGRTLYLAEIVTALESLEVVGCVDDLQVIRLSVSEQNLRDERSALGVQIGTRSTLGVDARIGGDPTAGGGRIIRSDEGRLLGIALRPYELINVRLSEQDLRLSGSAMSRPVDWGWLELDDDE